jgi:hypothetical protein
MSKNDDFSDLAEQLEEEVKPDLYASDLTLRAQNTAIEIYSESFESLNGLPNLMSQWLGREGHEQPNIPETNVYYPPFGEKYLKRKRREFARRGRHLGARQAFYSYSGELYYKLKDLSRSVEMELDVDNFENIIVVKGSLDGAHWFNLNQKNYYSLKYRIKKQLGNQSKKSKQKNVDFFYKIEVNRKKIEKIFLDNLGKKNFIKLSRNDLWRPFLTPSLKYLLRREISDKLNKIVAENFSGYRIFQSESR